ncbi:uncharacterized protein N7479_003869 [Penicillium vulpinum]|uniref:uncharacterized protein n=1 Tax=Penicillium vulpinum TaxID=29845 RepID=UPI002547B42B|nr:uncharacterized protein N7479_003869 [Penicillium vulpinum]KAJ5963993.1 hypothetical protein N7479_003869 [Penicillium vulpinum]
MPKFLPSFRFLELSASLRRRTEQWWDTRDWSEFRLPTMNASFDDRTANLTMSGIFGASWGVLDTYHSDVLDVNSSSARWLRTVGFGNNSLNIDNDARNAAGMSRISRGSASIMVLFVMLGLIISA